MTRCRLRPFFVAATSGAHPFVEREEVPDALAFGRESTDAAEALHGAVERLVSAAQVDQR